jgi:hypothetical protein
MVLTNRDRRDEMITIEFTYTTYFVELRIWDINLTSNFPASYNVYHSRSTSYENGKRQERFFTGIQAKILPDGINQGKNESGLGRLAKFIRKVKKMDTVQIIESDSNKVIINSFRTLPKEIIG